MNDFILSGERYRPVEVRAGTRAVKLKEVCTLTKGTHSSTKTEPGPYPLIVTAKKWLTSSDYQIDGEAVCVPLISSTGHGRADIKRIHFASGKFAVANLLAALQPKHPKLVTAKFLYLVLDLQKEKLAGLMKGAANVSMKIEDLAEFQIPLPPSDVQKEIVTEIEDYQKVIAGARAVLDNYQPHIPFHPEWPMVVIGDVVESIMLGLVKNKAEQSLNNSVPYIKMNNITCDGALDLADLAYVDATEDEVRRYALSDGDFIYNTRNAPNLVGKSAVFHGESGRYLFNNNILRIRFGPDALSDFVNTVMNSDYGKAKIRAQVDGTTSVAALYQKNYLAIEIPLPPVVTQQAIVAEIEAEQALVASNRELIARFDKKIEAALARVWGEE